MSTALGLQVPIEQPAEPRHDAVATFAVAGHIDMTGALSTPPAQSSSMPLQASGELIPAMHVTWVPALQRGDVVIHAPKPQVWLPGGESVHAPGVVPLQVPAVVLWQTSSQSICTSVPAGDTAQSSAGVRQARAPLQTAASLLIGARR
jgi:hypothetical protein